MTTYVNLYIRVYVEKEAHNLRLIVVSVLFLSLKLRNRYNWSADRVAQYEISSSIWNPCCAPVFNSQNLLWRKRIRNSFFHTFINLHPDIEPVTKSKMNRFFVCCTRVESYLLFNFFFFIILVDCIWRCSLYCPTNTIYARK